MLIGNSEPFLRLPPFLPRFVLVKPFIFCRGRVICKGCDVVFISSSVCQTLFYRAPENKQKTGCKHPVAQYCLAERSLRVNLPNFCARVLLMYLLISFIGQSAYPCQQTDSVL
jgi:hypothetical protein